jgi:hypothetical protein
LQAKLGGGGQDVGEIGIGIVQQNGLADAIEACQSGGQIRVEPLGQSGDAGRSSVVVEEHGGSAQRWEIQDEEIARTCNFQRVHRRRHVPGRNARVGLAIEEVVGSRPQDIQRRGAYDFRSQIQPDLLADIGHNGRGGESRAGLSAAPGEIISAQGAWRGREHPEVGRHAGDAAVIAADHREPLQSEGRPGAVLFRTR